MPGSGTDNSEFAAVDPTTKAPFSNSARQIWVTETALSTALNTSYMGSQLGLFGIVVGIALLLSGFGFAILAIGGALPDSPTVLPFPRRSTPHTPPRPGAERPPSPPPRGGPPQHRPHPFRENPTCVSRPLTPR